VACQKSLDGIPFTVDATMQIHCIDCFHQKFAPRCYACHRPILPIVGQEETIRIVALDRSYHIDCYRCEVSLYYIKKKITKFFLIRIVKNNLQLKKVVIQ
jgi:hypothetical protein